MSTQGGNLSKFHSGKLWTRPSKDQYLPAYFKQVCSEYMASEDPHRVFPVEVGTCSYKINTISSRYYCKHIVLTPQAVQTNINGKQKAYLTS